MTYFEQLNLDWKDAIIQEIADTDGGEQPEIADAFKKYYGKYLSKVVVSEKPDESEIYDIGNSYLLFRAGWNTAEKNRG